jgi:hypothetical protein
MTRGGILACLLSAILAPACAQILGLEPWQPHARADAGTPGAPVDGSRLVARAWAGDDGSGGLVGWRDTGLGVDCMPLPAADGRTRCLPAVVAWGGIYADAACSTRLVPASACAGATATVAEPGCPIAYRVWSVGAASMPAMVYVLGVGGCVGVANAGSAFVPLGAEMTLDGFVGGSVTP